MRTRPIALLALSILLAASAGRASAQDGPSPAAAASPSRETPAPADRGFGDVSQVTVVEVPVQVVYDGAPVRGLTADDFHVFDEGVEREVESFEVVDLAAAPAALEDGAGERSPIDRAIAADRATVPGAAVDPAGRRHFLLLFDLAFSRAHDLSRAERAARELVEQRLHPSDMVGVAVYTPRRGANLVLNFTTDRRQVLRVLDGFRELLDGDHPANDPDAGDRRADPLGLTAGTIEANLADLGVATGIETSLAEEAMDNGWAGPLGGRGGLEANKLLNMMWSAEQQIFDRRAGAISDFSRSLGSLARATAGIQGSKHLVLMSGGFDARLLESYIEAGPRSSDQGWWASGGGDWIRQEVESMLDELRRAGWVVQAVDLVGVGGGPVFRESLSLLARETGGTLYENSNDLGRAFGRVIGATAVTYVLSFTADASGAAGEDGFRELRIEVDGLPRGARVSHRAGYRAPGASGAPADDGPGSWSARRAELHGLLFSGRDQDAIGSALRAAAVPEGDGRWRVPVVLDLEGSGLLAGAPDGEVGVEVIGYAFAEDGTIADFFSQRIDLASERARGVVEGGGVRFLADLELPGDGRYRVRVIARSLRSGAASVYSVPFELAGDRITAPAVQPALLADADGGSWILARER